MSDQVKLEAELYIEAMDKTGQKIGAKLLRDYIDELQEKITQQRKQIDDMYKRAFDQGNLYTPIDHNLDQTPHILLKKHDET